jgi:sugar phosphate isomerase/epimerase
MSPNKVRRPPLVPPDRVMVAVNRDIGHELACAEEYGVGAEIQTFALPEMLVKDYSEDLEKIAERVKRLKGPIGAHGPFIDTTHSSLDPEIVRVCRVRYLGALDVAETLDARYALFHSQYNTLLKLETYPDIYHEASLRFWPEILEKAEERGIAVYIENMFDENPGPLRRLADALDSPRFKLCLDIAHSQIYSERTVAEWIDTYGEHLAHVHMNDTRGAYDDHLGLGEGSLDIPAALELLKATGLDITYALETNTHTRASLEFLGIHGSVDAAE